MKVWEAIAADAARVAGAPVAWIGVLEQNTERILGAVGTRQTAVTADASFAMRIRDEADLVVVADASADARLASHPLVAGAAAIRWYAGIPLRDEDGAFIGALSIIDRVAHTLSEDEMATLRILGRHAEREILLRHFVEEADSRFRDFFEHTSDLVMTIGPDGNLFHANDTALTTLGISRGAPLALVADPERRDELREVMSAMFATRQPQRIETVFLTAAGKRITVEGWLRPKVLDDHAVLARVAFRDVTDRKQFEADLGSARDAALEAARLKTQFLTNVSHEIRTPMNGIIGMIDLLLASPLTTEQLDHAHQARASAEQLLSVVNNILYVSNLEAGKLSRAMVDFDLYRTLERIVEVMKIVALGKDIDVRFVYDRHLPPVFRGHQSKIRVAVSNLIENAIKFTEEGSVTLSVSLQTETETHRVIRFEVRDTGIGVSDEDRLLLFERFSQIEATSTRRFQGVGLGLATARQLVETMGGLMDVDSEPGKGSTFWFTVPMPKHARDRRPVASSDLELKKKRVLLVDQQPTSRKVVRHYLEATWEMRVDGASSAAEALDMLRREAASDPYRVVVYDVDAIGFAREVRGDRTLAGTSLVHLANVGDVLDEEAMRGAGINAYTFKPVGQTELFDAVVLALAHDAIPLARAAGQPDDSRARPADVPMELRKSVRVLLAEDNFLNMKLTMSQLQKLGYVADSVANGKEVLEALKKNAYDIILMDCQMPIVDGYQATLEIRRLEKADGKRRRIIAMTANALEGDREKCLAAGMDDYLAKPTRAEDLEAALARFWSAAAGPPL